MGFFEIFMVLIVAIIFLGPDKLPQALVDLAKFFKAVKKTLDDAKTSLDKELNLEELKKEALEYKNSFTQSLEELNDDLKINDDLQSFEDFKSHPAKIEKSQTPQTEASKDPIQKTQLEENQIPAHYPKTISQTTTHQQTIHQESVHFVKPDKTNLQETSYKDS